MLVVAGLSLKNLKPRVWDPTSPYYLPDLRAVMVSYADFCRRRSWRGAAMERGLRAYLGVPDGVAIYLDNGAFYFLGRDTEPYWDEYCEFVAHARPDWWPIPRDFIPTPRMTLDEQRHRFVCTMKANRICSRRGLGGVRRASPGWSGFC
jgi:7-cyano-7-deazaguanine tRNA-ribosyltransferase